MYLCRVAVKNFRALKDVAIDMPRRCVIIGENNPNEIGVYTDTNKVLVRALGNRALFDMAALRTYWEGEKTGLPKNSTRVFQHRHVERLERDGGLESFHRRMKVPGARRRQAQVVVRPDVPGVALGCESEVAGRGEKTLLRTD